MANAARGTSTAGAFESLASRCNALRGVLARRTHRTPQLEAREMPFLVKPMQLYETVEKLASERPFLTADDPRISEGSPLGDCVVASKLGEVHMTRRELETLLEVVKHKRTIFERRQFWADLVLGGIVHEYAHEFEGSHVQTVVNRDAVSPPWMDDEERELMILRATKVARRRELQLVISDGCSDRLVKRSRSDGPNEPSPAQLAARAAMREFMKLDKELDNWAADLHARGPYFMLARN